MKLTIKNTFHNSVCSVVTSNGKLSHRQLLKIKRELCGQTDCHCGWNSVTDENGRPREIHHNYDENGATVE